MLKAFVGSVAVAFVVGLVFAQGVPENPPPSNIPSQGSGVENQTPGAPAGGTYRTVVAVQQHVAACLLLGNQQEVLLGEFAANQTRNNDVKQFAQLMVTDHTKAMSMLARFAPRTFIEAMRIRSEGTPRGRVSKADSTGQAPLVTPVSDPAPGAATAPDGNVSRSPDLSTILLTIERKAADNCFVLTRNELAKNQGAGFDKEYIGQQIVAHINMLGRLKAAEPYASAELRRIIRQAESDTAEHLETARKIMKLLAEPGR